MAAIQACRWNEAEAVGGMMLGRIGFGALVFCAVVAGTALRVLAAGNAVAFGVYLFLEAMP